MFNLQNMFAQNKKEDEQKRKQNELANLDKQISAKKQQLERMQVNIGDQPYSNNVGTRPFDGGGRPDRMSFAQRIRGDEASFRQVTPTRRDASQNRNMGFRGGR